MILNAQKNNQAISDINENVLELMNDKGRKAPYLASTLVNLPKPQNKNNFKLIKDSNSIRMKFFLRNRNILVTLYSKKLASSDSNKSFQLAGDLLKTMTN